MEEEVLTNLFPLGTVRKLLMDRFKGSQIVCIFKYVVILPNRSADSSAVTLYHVCHVCGVALLQTHKQTLKCKSVECPFNVFFEHSTHSRNIVTTICQKIYNTRFN